MQVKPNESTHKKFIGRSRIHDSTTGLPYMTRWFIGGLRLHQMHRGDLQRDCHDHPWWFLTFPLTPYVEEVLTYNPEAKLYERKLNLVKAFRFHFRPARYTHRILGRMVTGVPSLEHLFNWQVSSGSNQPTAFFDSIDEKQKKIWTLVLRGRVKQKWGFWMFPTDNRNGYWIKAKEYFARMNTPYEEGSTSTMPDNTDRRPA